MKLSLSSKILISIVVGFSLVFIVVPLIKTTKIKGNNKPEYGFEYATMSESFGDTRKPIAKLIDFIIGFFLLVYIFVVLVGFDKKNSSRDDKEKLIEARHIIINGVLGILTVLCLYVFNPLIWAKNDKFNPNLNHGNYGGLEKLPGGMVTIIFLNIIILLLPILIITLSKKTATHSSIVKNDFSEKPKDKNI